MGKNLSIDIYLYADFNKKNIFSILELGQKLGCIYYNDTGKYSSINELYEWIIKPNKKNYESSSTSVVVNEDGSFFLLFNEINNKINLHLFTEDCHEWTKESFPSGEKEIDTQRYLKLLREITVPYIIKKIKIETYFS